MRDEKRQTVFSFIPHPSSLIPLLRGFIMAEPTPLHDVTTRAGAVFTEEAGWSVPAHFGAPAAEYQQTITGCSLFDRSSRGKVELSGAEASFFLHNLCTNDINDLPLGGGCEAFLTTNKAKLVAH